MKILVAICVALLVSGVAASTIDARSLVIRTGEYQVTKLGSLSTRYSRNHAPTLGHAVRAFGKPSSSFHKYGGCVAKWRRLGLRIEFHNFGAPGADRCHPDVGLAQSFTIKRARNSRRWRTRNGLRIGTSEERLWKLHPAAEWIEDHEYYDDGYWLRQNYSPFGDGGAYPILASYIRGGRVSRFAGWIGAAGE